MVSEKNDGIVRLRRDDKIRFIAPNTNLSLWLFEKEKLSAALPVGNIGAPQQIEKSLCPGAVNSEGKGPVESIELIETCVASATGQCRIC